MNERDAPQSALTRLMPPPPDEHADDGFMVRFVLHASPAARRAAATGEP